MQFDEVLPQHFSTLSRDPFPHVLIERALLQLGGGSVDGNKFRNEALRAAGWRHSHLVPFGKYPDEACRAYNRLREIMAAHETAEAILEALQH